MTYSYTPLREDINDGDPNHDIDHEALHQWHNWVNTDNPYGRGAILNPVDVATTANITLSGEPVIDGYSTSTGNRILVKNQSTASQNGIYIVSATTWARASDANYEDAIRDGSIVTVRNGVINGNKLWQVTSVSGSPWTPGTDSLTFTEFVSGGGGGGGVDENVISVTDYGAVGDGTADDTAAFIAARDALIASAATSASGRIKLDLFVPEGTYKITSADALLYDGMPYIRGLKIRGQGKRRSIIRFETGLGTPATNFANNLATVNGNMNYVRIEGLTFESNNPNHTAFMFYSSNTEPVQDIGFYDCEWSGSWKRGLCFDGPGVGGDHNSEIQFFECATVNISTYTEAFLEVQPDGGDAGGDGSDQAVNFFFTNCKFELESGDILRFTRGGSVHIWGGSWLYTDTDPSNTSKMIVLGNPTYYTGPGAKQFSMQGVRTELRGEGQMLLDHYWGGGGTAPMVTLSNVSTYYSAYGGRGEQQMITIHGQPGGSASFGTLRIRDCDLYGHILVDRDVPQDRGVVIVEGSLFYNFVDLTNPVGISTDTTKPLRYVTGRTIPAHVFRNVYRISDVSVPGAGDGTLAGLTDTSINTPTSGQVLSYNGSAWANSEVDASVFKEYYVIATPDADQVTEKDKADWTLTAGTGIAAELAGKISAERKIYLIGNNIELDTYLEVVNASDVEIKSNGVTIKLPDAREFGGSSGSIQGVGGIFQLQGDWTSTPSISTTGPLAKSTTTINLVAGHGIQVGDWLHIRGDLTTDILNVNRPAQYIKSENHRVTATTSTSVTIQDGLVYDYAAGNQCLAYRIMPARNIILDGLKFLFAPTGGNSNIGLINIALAENVIVRNCEWSSGDTVSEGPIGSRVKQGLVLTTCNNVTVENCYAEYIDDTAIGYGIYPNGSCDVLIDRFHTLSCRHPVSSGQQWTTAGVPRYVTVQNSVASNAFEVAYDNHGGEYMKFLNNVVLNSRGAIHVRGAHTVIDGLVVLGLTSNSVGAIVIGEDDSSESPDGYGDGGTDIKIKNVWIDSHNTSATLNGGVLIYDPLINSDIDVTCRTRDRAVHIRCGTIKNSTVRVRSYKTYGFNLPIDIQCYYTGPGTVENNTFIVDCDGVGSSTSGAVNIRNNGATLTLDDNNYYISSDTSNDKGINIYSGVNVVGTQYLDKFTFAGTSWSTANITNGTTGIIMKPTYTGIV